MALSLGSLFSGGTPSTQLFGGLFGSSAGDQFNQLSDPLNIFKPPDLLGDPLAQEDPQAIAEQEALDAAIAGDIATKNRRRRSSTAGAGQRFIRQQTQGFQDTGPTTFFNARL